MSLAIERGRGGLSGRTRTPGRARRARGLTLIEVLVALTIFALLSGVAYRGLDAVLEARERVERETARWREAALAFVSIEQSLACAVARSIRERSGSIAPAFAGSASVRGEEARLTFTRMGYPDQRGALGDLQRVGLRVREETLEQLIWPVLDQAPSTAPQAAPLLPGVAAMSLRYLSRDGSWRTEWPLPADDAMPRALEITLDLKSGEKISRVLALP